MANKSRRNAARFHQRFERVATFLRDLLGHYETEQAHWEVSTLLDIIRGAVASLAHHVQNPKDRQVSWHSPFAELQHEVRLDWRAFGRGRRHLVHETFTAEDLENSSRVADKLVKAFLSHRNLFVLGRLTNDVIIVRRENREHAIFPTFVLNAVRRIPKTGRVPLLRKLIEPFSFGATLLSERDIKPRSISQGGLRRLRRVAAEPRLAFSGRYGRQRIKGSVGVLISPPIVDEDTHRAYYPITIGIAFEGGAPPSLSTRRRREFWKDLLAGLDDLIAEYSTWDPSFLGKAELWNRDSPRGKRASRKLLAIADGSAELTSVGHREFEELVAELYAGLGCRVRLTRRSKDGGRDVIVEQGSPIALRAIIECKRPKRGKKVGVLPVRALLGVASDERPTKAVLVTATGFTDDAKTYESRNQWRVELIDARGLSKLIRQYRARCSSEEPNRGRH